MFYQYRLLDVVQHTGSGQVHMPKPQFDLGACLAEWSSGVYIQPLSGKTKEKSAVDFYQITKPTSTRVLLCPSKLCIQVFVVLQLDVQVCVRVV